MEGFNLKNLEEADTQVEYCYTQLSENPIHCAAFAGVVSIVSACLSSENADERDTFNRTALHCAVLGGNLDIFNLLVEAKANVNAIDFETGASTLHYAVLGGNSKVTATSLRMNASVHSTDNGGRSPLHYAALAGYVENVDLLLKEGADCSAKDEGGATPLHYAAMGDNLQSLNVLKHVMFDSALGYEVSPLDFLAFKGKTQLGMGKSISSEDSKDVKSDNPSRVWTGNFEVFILLLGKGTDNSFTDKNGANLLHYAAYGGNPDIFKQLLHIDTDHNAPDQWMRLPLHYAALGGNMDIVNLLLDRGVDVNARDKNGASPLHFAAYGGNFAIFEKMFDSMERINETDSLMRTPLHYACLGRNFNIVKRLLDDKSEVDAPDTDEATPLHYAAMGGNEKIVRFLINANADHGKEDIRQKIPLHYAAEGGHSDAFNLLKLDTPRSDELVRTFHKNCKDGGMDSVHVLVSNMVDKLQISRHGHSEETEIPQETTIKGEDGEPCDFFEVPNSLLQGTFKEEIEEGSLILLPRTICMNNFDLQIADKPVEVEVNVKTIMQAKNGECCTEDGFFVLCKTKDEVSDITNKTKPRLEKEKLSFSCNGFKQLTVGWTAVKRFIQRIAEFWKRTFRAKLCPSIVREQYGYSVGLYCHTQNVPGLQHTCGESHPVDVPSASMIKFQVTWFTEKGEETKWSSAQQVDRQVWKTTGTCISELAALVGSVAVIKAFTIQGCKEVCIDSWRIKVKAPVEPYPRKGRGLVVIINNINFASDKGLERTGSEIDVKNVKSLFKDTIQGHYDVLCGNDYEDCSAQRTWDILKEVQDKLRGNRYNQLLWFMFSHGEEIGLLTHDRKYIRQEDITAQFNGDNVKEMMDLPKVFVFQACRGRLVNMSVFSADSPMPSPEKTDKVEEKSKTHLPVVRPADAHVVTAYATTSGHYAYRDSSGASVFITAFCDEVAQHYESKHLTDMLTSIQGKVSGMNFFHNRRDVTQMPIHYSTFTKPMYLHSSRDDTSPAKTVGVDSV